jgi:hypothetical protein
MNARPVPAVSWSDDLLLTILIHDFLAEFRSAVCYPNLVQMSYAAFDSLGCAEQGRVFETALGRYIMARTGRRIQVITGAGSLDFGLGLGTLSGVRHEVDLVMSSGTTLFAFEAKHYLATEVTKDMLAVFNQKTLDFYLELLRRGLPISMKRVFVARTNNYAFKVREFAWSWGIALLGGDQPHPIWLHAQLRRWLDTRGPTPTLLEHALVAEELAAVAMRDLADLIEPFSRKQASLRLDQLVPAERCESLVRAHEQVAEYWRGQRDVVRATN